MVDIKTGPFGVSLSKLFGSTDNRGYDLCGSSKMSVAKKFSTSDIGQLSSTKSVVIGESKIALKLRFFGASVVSDSPGKLMKDSFWATKSPRKSVMYIRTRRSPSRNGGTPDFVFDGWNSDIDWSLRVSVTKGFRSDGQHTANVLIEGSHNDFPWYEGYVNGIRVYSYASPFTKAKGISFGLIGDLKKMKSASFTVVWPC